MKRWKLRTRIALASALAMLVGVALLEIGVQALLARELHQQLDHTLQQRAADVDEIAETHPRAIQRALESDPAGIGTSVEVVNRQGEVIAPRDKIGQSPITPLVNEVIKTGEPRFVTITIKGHELRVFMQKLEPRGAVLVASSTDAIEDGLSQARWLTLVAGIVAAGVAAGVCLLVANRALRPLTRLNEQVMEVQRTADPSRRVVTEPTGDELEQLGKALNAMLEALQRAREVERRFLADASHEMRTPLTALRGNAAYLARHGADAEAEAFLDLENDMARLAQLLDRLLALAREDAAAQPTQPVAVDDILDRFRTDPRLRVTLDPELYVRADADAIERALTNLIENAKLYGPEGGLITVSAALDDEEVVLTVTDTGTGIPGATFDEATTRFWRGPNSAGLEGAGLGLGLVRSTAERHGGSLTIDGASFSIRLPALLEITQPQA